MEVKDTPANRKKCVCPGCPSYPEGCKGELLYCSVGKSRCDIKAAGCICPGCPVYSENRLSGLYFCGKELAGTTPVLMRKRNPQESREFYQAIVDIKDMAASGKSIIRSMGSRKRLPLSLDDLHFVPAQIARVPLNSEEKVNTGMVIGPAAKKPLRVSSPIMISGMSFGATSRNAKLAISRAAAKLKASYNSGEGGILPEELKASEYLIGQYSTGRFGADEDVLKKVAAVEIRFGQGAYPGKGSYLPAEKMTPEVAALRGLKGGESSYSPARHHDMANPKQIREKVSWLKELTAGVPVGAKIGCGNIEEDVRILAEAGADFICLDGFGGGTGATDFYARENVGIPIFAAIPRAHRLLKRLGLRERITLIAGGGLKTSPDFAKCLALGADAVYIGTPALIAINCEQYRICHTGLCPTGVTTHKPALTKQLDPEKGAERLCNFLKVCTEEIAGFCRIVGKDDIRKLSSEDLVAIKKEMAELTGVKWMDGKNYGTKE